MNLVFTGKKEVEKPRKWWITHEHGVTYYNYIGETPIDPTLKLETLIGEKKCQKH